ncbi:MAG: hypothetical protein ACM35G_05740 [Planctomycetaceae bacterium]
MGSQTVEQQAASPRKRSSRLGSKPPTGMAAKKVKSTIHLSLEASQRLDIHATMMNLDRSALVEKLISEHLRRYVVSNRGGAETSAEATAFTSPGLARAASTSASRSVLPRCQGLARRSIIRTLSPVIGPVAVRRVRSLKNEVATNTETTIEKSDPRGRFLRLITV